MKDIPLKTQKSILNKYTKFIVHMRRQIKDQRFGLVMGAGASRDLGFPDWNTLIKRISEHKSVNSSELINEGSAQSSVSQLIYHRFRENIQTEAKHHSESFKKRDTFIQAKWREVVHECLYKDVPESIDEIKDKDNYLWSFIPVIKKTKITINYNFDDTLQKLLADSRSEEEKTISKGYTTVFNSKIQGYPGTGIIYHPNGFLPRRLTEKPSDQLVFLEDSFADQLIESMTGYHTAIAYHYSQNTCLFLGLSLDDPMLKHLLRHNAANFPGHYQYLISFISNDRKRKPEHERAIFESNFDVFNLNTLFLNRKEIAALGLLLGMSDNEFIELCEETGVNPLYYYFVTGCVSVGKSTAVSNFSSLVTHDEWLEPRESGMEKDPTLVKKDIIKKIDEWVYDQLGKKNKVLLRETEGINIVDRAPLDAFAFNTPKKSWPKKAKLIMNKVRPDRSETRLCKGHIILLVGDPNVMEVRSILKHKMTDSSKLQKQQDSLLEVYKRNKVTIIDTRNYDTCQVAKQIARIIYCEDYNPVEMHDWLEKIEKGQEYD
ncbi:MAG: SIR2 family protein [Geobacteraceae bacterium]|nr:SIR2 family protein [Geobacteraceae bacterium]